MTIKLFSTLLLFVVFSTSLFAQNEASATKADFKAWFESVRKDQLTELPFKKYSKQSLKELAAIAKGYQNDTIFEVRWQAASVSYQLGAISNDQFLKQASASLLLGFMYDTDNRIVNFASDVLLRTKGKGFTASQKDTVAAIVTMVGSPKVAVNIYKLCGYLNLEKSIATLEAASTNRNYSFIQRWAALASLTRMGNDVAEQKMFDFIKKTKVSLDAINTLYPYVLFSQSRTNVGYLISLIENDEFECESSNPDYSAKVPCSYMILLVVGPHIADLNWSGKNGLEMLSSNDATLKAKEFFKKVEGNWSLINN